MIKIKQLITRQTISNKRTNKKSSSKKSTSQSKSSSSDSQYGSNVKKHYFTVSENEKGQNEGMRPGRYVEYYNDKGPIETRRIGS